LHHRNIRRRDNNNGRPNGGYGRDQQPGGDYRANNNGSPNGGQYGGQDQQYRGTNRSRDNGQQGNWNQNDGNTSNNYGDPNRGQGYGQNGAVVAPNNNQPFQNTITVTSATYGASCKAPKGNVTKFVQTACNGQTTCQYAVQYKTIGDPAPGCSKDFAVEWTCSTGAGGSAAAPGEAGFGSKVSLACPAAAR
jgi:hypothetical protein